MSDAFYTFSSHRWGLVVNLFTEFLQMKFGTDVFQSTIEESTFENTIFENEALVKKVKGSLNIDFI